MAKKTPKKKEGRSIVSKEKENSKNFSFKVDFNLVKKIFPIFLIFLVMLVAFQVRSGPINLDGLNDNIKANTYAQIKNLISQQINSEYKNVGDFYKQELIEKEYQKVLKSGIYETQGQKINIEQVVKQNSKTIKNSFKADNGQTYLNAIDSYYWLRASDNYFKNGYTGDKLVDGKPRDSLRLAPNGMGAGYNPGFHTKLGAFLMYFNGLKKDSPIGEKTKAIYLIPVFFAVLSGVLSFFIIRRFSNDLFALFGSLLLVSIGTFVSRTVAGFVDTDAYNVFFPLLVIVFLIYGFVYKNKYLTILFATLAGFSQGWFLSAWGDGWFIFLFVNLALLGYLGYIILLNIIEKIKIKELLSIIENDLYTIFAFIISSFIFSYFINNGLNIFKLTYNGIFGALANIASVSQTNIWPNVLSSVAELNPASFGQIISSVGGNIIFLIAMLGLVFLSTDFISKNSKFNLYKKVLIIFSIVWFVSIINFNLFVSFIANSPLGFLILLYIPIGISLILSLLNKNKSDKIFLVLLLSIWMAGTVYMSFNGVRFILLLAPAFTISFGIGLYYISKIINNFLTNEFKIVHNIKKVIGGFLVTTILFFTLFSPIYSQAMNISKFTTPNFDDAWYSSMNKIENNSKSDAIITSWWDFGHFFAAVANRGVTFDGGSQTVPASHWVGKLLMENDEDVSRDILRMLVCGNNKAFDTMLKFTEGTNADAVKINKIIYLTFGKNIEETKKVLENNKYYNYNSNQVDEIMQYLACSNPPENFVITSQDMVGKAGVWAHWGSWDFTKKYVYDSYNSKSAQEIANEIDENVTLIEKYVEELKQLEIRATTKNIKRENLANQWFAPYPSYIPLQGRYEFPCAVNNQTLQCQNGLEVDLFTGKILNDLNGQVNFKNLIYPSQTGKVSIVEQNPNGNVDALLIPTGAKTFNIMIMQTPLGGSLFTKLFYLNGYGLKYFKSFDAQQSATGNKILVWKVNFDENNINGDLSNFEVASITYNATEEEVQTLIGNNTN